MQAIKDKQLTPNVLTAYEYYMGTPYGSNAAGGTPTPTSRSLGTYSHLLGLPDDFILKTLGSEIDNGNLDAFSALNIVNKLGVK